MNKKIEVQNYSDVQSHLIKSRRSISLLMGNGFSVAFDKNIFTYNALADFLISKSDPLINNLFNTIKTKNFELIMQQLKTTIQLLHAFKAEERIISEITEASAKLKNGLIRSIQEMHPEHVFKVSEEKSNCCANFLNLFLKSKGEIFTTNYDLLLYWTLVRNNLSNHIDGFGKELENDNFINDGEIPQWSNDVVWGPNSKDQNIHYLHGALHIFNEKINIIKEQYDPQNYLLENITQRIEDGTYPVFVTAGSSLEKLEQIRSNRYLSFCYDKLCNINGSLVTFGFNFGEYDEHIIDALNKAHHSKAKMPPKLWSIYIGTYNDSDVQHIRSIEHKFAAPIRIFDAKTAPVWSDI